MQQLPVSAYQVIREYPLSKAEKLWSAGKTIREYPDQEAPVAPWNNETYKAAHAKHCAAAPGQCWVDQAELQHLIATSEQAIPSPENQTVPTHDTTIAQELTRAGYVANPADKVEAVLADLGHYEPTPWTRVDPLTQRRIDWERRTKLSSNTLKLSLREINNIFQVAITGIELTPEQRINYAKRYIARLTRDLGAVPTLEQVRAFHAKFAELRKAGHKANLATLEPQAQDDYDLATYPEPTENPTRDAWTLNDLELHDTAIITMEPDPIYDEEGNEIPNTDKPEKRVLLRTHKGVLHFLGYNLDDDFDRPDEATIRAYHESIMSKRGDYLATTAAIGTTNDLAMTEWDLGTELQDDPRPVNQYLPDLADPLELLVD